jgi:hypothetical protein
LKIVGESYKTRALLRVLTTRFGPPVCGREDELGNAATAAADIDMRVGDVGGKTSLNLILAYVLTGSAFSRELLGCAAAAAAAAASGLLLMIFATFLSASISSRMRSCKKKM